MRTQEQSSMESSSKRRQELSDEDAEAKRLLSEKLQRLQPDAEITPINAIEALELFLRRSAKTPWPVVFELLRSTVSAPLFKQLKANPRYWHKRLRLEMPDVLEDALGASTRQMKPEIEAYLRSPEVTAKGTSVLGSEVGAVSAWYLLYQWHLVNRQTLEARLKAQFVGAYAYVLPTVSWNITGPIASRPTRTVVYTNTESPQPPVLAMNSIAVLQFASNDGGTLFNKQLRPDDDDDDDEHPKEYYVFNSSTQALCVAEHIDGLELVYWPEIGLTEQELSAAYERDLEGFRERFEEVRNFWLYEFYLHSRNTVCTDIATPYKIERLTSECSPATLLRYMLGIDSTYAPPLSANIKSSRPGDERKVFATGIALSSGTFYSFAWKRTLPYTYSNSDTHIFDVGPPYSLLVFELIDSLQGIDVYELRDSTPRLLVAQLCYANGWLSAAKPSDLPARKWHRFAWNLRSLAASSKFYQPIALPRIPWSMLFCYGFRTALLAPLPDEAERPFLKVVELPRDEKVRLIAMRASPNHA